ncbi:hypothetical protein [Cetobacterium somerae]|uniref:hypothetical protein n=1 Tax=Cetobacterium somerae TaxID=188913 RepID=UPI00248DE715|nr:hypothetical protein [Cetobacterium somerae]
MEPWQEKILTEIFHKDFLEDKEIIGRAFQEVCKPIEGKGNEQHKCIYNGVIEDKEDEFYCMFELELQIYSYQLTVFNDYLRLLVGKKTQYYLENKLITPMCKIEYSISENQEIYKVKALSKIEYEKYVGYNFEDGDSMEMTEVTDFIFDDNKYIRVINNLMNIAETGTFKGERLFEKKQKISAKDLGL